MKRSNMERFDQKEYQTVVLASLLHDIGKFLQRVTGVEGFSGMHQDLGADFVSGKDQFSKSGTHSQLHSFSDMIDDDWIDKDKLEHCIRKHHKGSQPWGWIVHKADSYSTKERFKEAEGVTTYPPRGRLIALKSVFASVDLGNIGQGGIFGYNAATLDSFQSFPEQNKDKIDYR